MTIKITTPEVDEDEVRREFERRERARARRRRVPFARVGSEGWAPLVRAEKNLKSNI